MANIFWMPIQTRTEMLTTGTGFRSQLGIKVYGKDLSEIQNVSIQIERTLTDFPDTRSAFAERTTADISWTSRSIAKLRRGMSYSSLRRSG